MRDFPLMALEALILTAITFGFSGATAAQERRLASTRGRIF